MWLLAFFHAETALGRIVKISTFSIAAAMLFGGLVLAPEIDPGIAVALPVLAVLWVHGYMDDRRESFKSPRCIADIREDERRIRVLGGGVDLSMRLASRTVQVNRVSKELISSDAPGEFQRARSGSFAWPLTVTTTTASKGATKHNTKHDTTDAAPEAVSIEASDNETMRWRDFAPPKTASRQYVVPYAKAVAATAPVAAITQAITQEQLAVHWNHPGHGMRLLFTVSGPGDQYEALTRAFAVFSTWIRQEDEALRAAERREEVEKWQRDWEANRLAEESRLATHIAIVDDAGNIRIEDTLAPVLANTTPPAASRRW